MKRNEEIFEANIEYRDATGPLTNPGITHEVRRKVASY